MKKINIKGNDYVMVNERVKQFRIKFPDWSIITRIINIDNNSVLMVAEIADPSGMVLATGHAHEFRDDGKINLTSYVENCETSAVGRALAFLGVLIEDNIASADEIENAQLEKVKAFTDKMFYETLNRYINGEKDVFKKAKEAGFVLTSDQKQKVTQNIKK